MTRKRLAFFGPLPPTPSGISDYDEELLELLREHFDIDVYVDGTPMQPGAFHYSRFTINHRKRAYDLPVYQMGNSMLHEYMYGFLFHYPGALVLHDYCLHFSRAKMLLTGENEDEYLQEVTCVHPDTPALGRTVWRGMAGNLLLYYFPLAGLAVRSSLATGAHTSYVVERLSEAGHAAIKIPMSVRIRPAAPVPPPEYPGKLVVASFGLVTREKRLSPVLAALAELRCFYPHLKYLVVGEIAAHYNFLREVEDAGLSGVVEVTGRVDSGRFHSLLQRADIVVNLRYPSAGEMSATLLRALAYGKPVLMSRLLQWQEIPEDAVMKIRPDRELEDVFEALWRLIENPFLRIALGNRARAWVAASHRPEQTLNAYLRLIDAALVRKERFVSPEFPLHLRTARELLLNYLAGADTSPFTLEESEWILQE
jgi:glycosyltransferase involved in cell wall biosynthesis